MGDFRNRLTVSVFPNGAGLVSKTGIFDPGSMSYCTVVLQQCIRNRVCATTRINRGDDMGRSGLRCMDAVSVQVDPQSA